MSFDVLDYQARENRILEKFKRGEVSPQDLPTDVSVEFARAKQALQLNVLADTFGGLMGPDALGAETDAAGERYVRALEALEKAVGLDSGSGVNAGDAEGDNV